LTLPGYGGILGRHDNNNGRDDSAAAGIGQYRIPPPVARSVAPSAVHPVFRDSSSVGRDKKIE
jgi:hypothetical protein